MPVRRVISALFITAFALCVAVWIGSHWRFLQIGHANGPRTWNLCFGNGAVCLFTWEVQAESSGWECSFSDDLDIIRGLNGQYALARYQLAGFGFDLRLDQGRRAIGRWFLMPMWFPVALSGLLAWVFWPKKDSRLKESAPRMGAASTAQSLQALQPWFIRIPFLLLLALNVIAWSESCRAVHFIAFGREAFGIGRGLMILDHDARTLSPKSSWTHRRSPNTFTSVDYLGEDVTQNYETSTIHLFGFSFIPLPLARITIPFWSTTTASAILLYYFWQMTKKHVPGRAFPVEVVPGTHAKSKNES